MKKTNADMVLQAPLVKYIQILLQITTILIVPFFAYHIWVGNNDQALLEGLLVVAFTSVLQLLKKGLYIVYVMHAMMLIGLLGLLLSMVEEPSTVLWAGALVIGSFALLGKKHGLYWVVIVNMSLLLFMLTDAQREIPLYSSYLAINVVLSCIWISLIAFYAYRNTAEQHEIILNKETEQERRAMAKTLASGVAHLINNEMLVMIGRAENLQFRMKNKEDIDELEKVIALGFKTSVHANQLLSYAQGSAKKMSNVCLYETFATVLQQWQGASPSQVQVNMNKPSREPCCFGDAVQLGQVFMNLLENGKEAIEQRGKQEGWVSHGTITISFEEKNQKKYCKQTALRAGKHIVLCVMDDGCGIENEIKAKIFEPFTSTKFKGRGLGLAAAYGIVKSHHGHIDVESQAGKGSTFYVWLPVAPCE